MAPYAFVTLLTSDSYLPGALVTAHSLKQAEQSNDLQDFDLVCLITLESISVESIKALRKVFNLVISVDEIRSRSKDELNLLGRQDLSSTITKIHIWRLVQYQQIVYVDADTLILKSISHLFRVPHEFSASPDTGWPDCFNSGLMVIQPSLDTFERLYTFFSQRGSWDGGDQGLLNEFFCGDAQVAEDASAPPAWNRLSFTYNVTPSAYYTYAPAYRRFGDKISMIHFIGQEKPWHFLSQRHFKPRSQPQSSNNLPAVDYDALVSKWADVYERAYGPIQSANPSHIKHEFKFPQYAAEWNNRQPSRYEPPTVDKLKEIFTRKTGDSLGTVPLLHENDAYGDEYEGRYMSMPLPGRPHLFLNQCGFQTWQEKGKSKEQSRSPCEVMPVSTTPTEPSRTEFSNHEGVSSIPEASAHDRSPDLHSSFPLVDPLVDVSTHQTSNQQHTQQHEHHVHNHVWDAARSPPPNHGFQMSNPITARYEAAWDQPVSHQSGQFFEPPPQPKGFIPPITHQDYSQIASSSPNLQSVKPIFPWEENAADSTSRKPTRVFPKETEFHDPQKEGRDRVPSYNSDAFSDDAHLQTHQPSIEEANLSQIYRNAWDEHPFIKRYADALSGTSYATRASREEAARKSVTAQLAQTPHLERKSFLSGSQFENHPFESTSASDTAATFRIRRDSETSSRDGDEEDVGSEDEGSETGTASGRDTQVAKIDPLSMILPDRAPGTTTSRRRPQLYRGNESVGSVSRIPTVRSIIIGVPIGMDSRHGAGGASDSVPGETSVLETRVGLTKESDDGTGTTLTMPILKASRVFSPTTDTGTLKQSGLDALQKLVKGMEDQEQRVASGGIL